MDRTRHALAVVAVLALAGAAAWWAAGETAQAGVAARVGAVLAAVWIAWPSLTGTSPRSWAFGAAALAAILIRPRAAWIVVPALAFALARRRERRPS